MKIPFIVHWKNIVSILLSICCLLLAFVVSGCGDDYDLSNTGSYACSIKWPEDVPTLETTSTVSRAIDCDAAGVVTVAFTFYDGGGSYLTGDEWSCSLHQGTVYGIPAGTNRRLVVTGEDASGTVLYRGEQTGIEIFAGQTTQGEEIEMEYVYDTAPSAPTNVVATAGDGEVAISWDSVSGATSYNIYWATYSGVSKADYEGVVSDVTSSYTHTDLTNDTTYYYVVTAENSYEESDESDEVDATPDAGENPTAPEISNIGRRVTASTETINITTDSVDTDFDTYQAKGAQYTDWTDVSTPITFNLSTDDTWYTLQIRAKDQAGNLSTSVSLLLFKGEKTILNTHPNVVHADNDWFYEDHTLSINYSPYLVSHRIVFYENVTINAGVTIYFDSAVGVQFHGSLDINGSSGNVVTFTSNASTPDEGDYDEIYFVGKGNLTIDYAIFEYASKFRANGKLDETQIININDSIFRYLDIGTSCFSTADVNFSYCEFQCRPTATNQGAAFSNTTSTGWPVNTINIDYSYFHHCGTAVFIAQKKIYNIANSNFTNNDRNIWITSTNDENNDIANNYWGYDNPGGSLSDLEIVDQGTGSLTWSPYSTSQVSGAGPR